jgi:hypothetical protein
VGVTMKNSVLWDVRPCGSSKNRHSVRRLLVTATVVTSSPILVILMMEALGSSETSVLTRAIRRNIPEDGILDENFVRLQELLMLLHFHYIC